MPEDAWQKSRQPPPGFLETTIPLTATLSSATPELAASRGAGAASRGQLRTPPPVEPQEASLALQRWWGLEAAVG